MYNTQVSANLLEEIARCFPRGGADLCVALDIDGTLVDHRGQMSPAVAQLVQRTIASGVEVVLASGRNLPAVTPTVDRFDIKRGWAVTSNGAVLSEVHAKRRPRVAAAHTFEATQLVEGLSELCGPVPFALSRHDALCLSTVYIPQAEALLGTLEVVPVEDLAGQRALSLVVAPSAATFDEAHSFAVSLGFEPVVFEARGQRWLDIARGGISKASGLESLCAELGLTSENFIAVGDGNNDTQMLQWAGLGVAMGDGTVAAKAAADVVTTDLAADGVAVLLAALLEYRANFN